MSKGFGASTSSAPSPTAKKLKRSIIKQFEALEDPRVKRKPDHLLIDIIAIAILAVISGADNMVAVETYGKAKQQWLETFLELPNGIPSHDTFSRVLALIAPQQLHECFLSWVKHITEKLEIKLINIDGKTARGSYDREQKLKALHTVSAWASEHHLVLAQQRVESKSNEITAIPELLNLLDIKGAIITLDAMGTQRNIATQIIDQGETISWRSRGIKANSTRGWRPSLRWLRKPSGKGLSITITSTQKPVIIGLSIDECGRFPSANCPICPMDQNGRG